MDCVDGLIEQAKLSQQIHDEITAIAETKGSFGAVCNEFALRVARRFANDEMDFTDADTAMNMLWTAMTARLVEHPGDLVEPAFSVYEAFDAGEYDHGDGVEPVEAHTRPRIEEILASAGD